MTVTASSDQAENYEVLYKIFTKQERILRDSNRNDFSFISVLHINTLDAWLCLQVSYVTFALTDRRIAPTFLAPSLLTLSGAVDCRGNPRTFLPKK